MIQIKHCGALEKLVLQMGFLPFFKNRIPQFSIEEFTPEHLWFPDDEEGPWEWKGPVLREGDCAYGKLFQKKAGFVSMDWFPELVNYRRSVYKLNEEPSDSMDRIIYDTVSEHESLLSKEIKKVCGSQGYETAITRLQMGTWLVVADFEYLYNRQGDPYGWGIARYITPEALFGKERILSAAHHSPEESRQRLTDYLTRLLPQATHTQILKMIG